MYTASWTVQLMKRQREWIRKEVEVRGVTLYQIVVIYVLVLGDSKDRKPVSTESKFSEFSSTLCVR